jgi:hypothetical protein
MEKMANNKPLHPVQDYHRGRGPGVQAMAVTTAGQAEGTVAAAATAATEAALAAAAARTGDSPIGVSNGRRCAGGTSPVNPRQGAAMRDNRETGSRGGGGRHSRWYDQGPPQYPREYGGGGGALPR